MNNEAKRFQLHGGYRQIQNMRSRCEHAFAEAKGIHGLDRARNRGLDRLQEQATWTAIVQNLKRLCRFKAQRPLTGSSVYAVSREGHKNVPVHASFLRFLALLGEVFHGFNIRKDTFSPDF
ncbi:transposase [Paenibacillus massiliensis]|uniref:transposase n=1 Tax=Paenibacillus massiliensis TaxID=225917 RepID=UPI0038503C8B